MTVPIYEYQCEECTQEFEDLVLSGSAEPQSCPHCGGKKLTRLASTFGFSGSGSRGSGPSCAGCKSNSCRTCGS
jgi:putative FmdB family regulatory protein